MAVLSLVGIGGRRHVVCHNLGGTQNRSFSILYLTCVGPVCGNFASLAVVVAAAAIAVAAVITPAIYI